MLWPHDIEIDSQPGGEPVDATFGQPTGTLRLDPVYRGRGRVMSNEMRTARLSGGTGRLQADFLVYLPPGDFGIQENQIFRWGTVTGRVQRVTLATTEFYTQIEVGLEGV